MLALITRPWEDAEDLARALRATGIRAAIEPLLAIRQRPGVQFDLAGVQAILATSANGARALAGAIGARDVPVFAVGDATATAARKAGFSRVESAGGNVADLIRLASARLDPKAGRLVHASGSAVAGNLGGGLAEKGFAVARAVLYDAMPAERFTAAAAALFRDEALDLVLFFSPRTGETFVRLAQKAEIGPCCRRVAAICLSVAVADKIRILPWAALRIAAEPTEAALIAETIAVANEMRLRRGAQGKLPGGMDGDMAGESK